MGIRGQISRTVTGTLFALALTLPVAAQSGHTGSLDSIHIGNFGRVNATYYRGAQPGGHDYADLAALGVKTVIDLQLDADRSEAGMVKTAGMTYVNIGMTTSVAPTPAQIEQFLQLVNDPASQPVYVHCAGGRHRTGVMSAVYRMVNDGWTSDQAFKEMKQYNFGPDFLHPAFKRFVYAYHAQAPAAPAVVVATATPVLAVPVVTATATK